MLKIGVRHENQFSASPFYGLSGSVKEFFSRHSQLAFEPMFLLDEIFFRLPASSLANSTEHRFAPPPFRPSVTLIPLRGTKGAPRRRMTQENPSMDFLGYCRSRRLLHAAKPRIHALVTLWQVRGKYPSLDFFMIAESLRNSACC